MTCVLRGLGVVVAVAVAMPTVARAQAAPAVALDGIDGAAALDALARECYEAGLAPDMPSADMLDCSGIIDERVLVGAPAGADRIVVTHKIRFTLLGRAGEARVGADVWTATEERDNVIEQAVTAEAYLRRVQRVLNTVVARLAGTAAPPWAGRYESEQAWRLDAHLKAVSHCDANLERMTAASVAAELARIGVRPLRDDARDRCEQLYSHLLEWGLARGDADPTVAEYERYRAALPPEQRSCEGALAPDASCPL
jgi:hypothetical protein